MASGINIYSFFSDIQNNYFGYLKKKRLNDNSVCHISQDMSYT